MIFDSSRIEFSASELAAIAELHEKVARCFGSGKPIHPKVYEFLRANTKGVCTEVLAFDRQGRIFLNDRPVNNQGDPYAGRVALTGVTHAAMELESAALHRLLRTELQGLGILRISQVRIDEIYDADFPRGRYVSFFRYALVEELSGHEETKAFETPPWDRLILSSAQRIQRWLWERPFLA